MSGRTNANSLNKCLGSERIQSLFVVECVQEFFNFRKHYEHPFGTACIRHNLKYCAGKQETFFTIANVEEVPLATYHIALAFYDRFYSSPFLFV